MTNNSCFNCGWIERPPNNPDNQLLSVINQVISLAEINDSRQHCRFCRLVYSAVNHYDKNRPAKDTQIVIHRGLAKTIKIYGTWEGAVNIELYADNCTYSSLHMAVYMKITIANLKAEANPESHPEMFQPDLLRKRMNESEASQTIRRWQNICMSHEKCNAQRRLRNDGTNSLILPTRLLCVEGTGKYIARLVRAPIGGNVAYAALSYCWGNHCSNLTTEAHTIIEREEGIMAEDVPQTLLDAIKLTAALGIKYLWIDALCIIQNDKWHWERECANMGVIYGNATIVLSATSAECSHTGFLQLRTDDSVNPSFQLPDANGNERAVYARECIDHQIMTFCRAMTDKRWKGEISKDFRLLSRGWAFQERNLSTRMVHFTRSELVWECQEMTQCECGEIRPGLNNMKEALQFCLNRPNAEIAARVMWRENVKSYTRRSLTMADDRLPALAGIASQFANATKDEYLAGIWRRALPFDLLWRCDQSIELKSIKDRKPSWSWSSVDCGINWPSATEDYSIIPHFPSKTNFEGEVKTLIVEAPPSKLKTENPFGAVLSSKLVVKGPVSECPMPRRGEWNEHEQTNWTLIKDAVICPVWPDVELHEVDTGESGLILLEIMTRGNESHYLVLKPTELTTDTEDVPHYERVAVTIVRDGKQSEEVAGGLEKEILIT